MKSDSPSASARLESLAAASISPSAEWIAIAAGGAIGAMLRFAISRLFASGAAHPALATLVVNLTGAFALGLLLARIEERRKHPLLYPFLVIGLLGSFTTFSALVLHTHSLANQSGELLATLHILVSIALGLCAFALGARAASSLGEGDPAAAIPPTDSVP